ncbi:MAG: hypothetical protein PHG08_06780 [Bacilli bacterium]|mgnify:CR=1 FL=1|jgi:hypothetical protein|nr:hypothetical protein [Bacilli bacterium]HHU24381.1 hypothetical protein [Acholeplasmataceae bacterium]
MSRFKKIALIMLLLINILVLAFDYYQVKEFIRTVDANKEYVAYIYSQLLFFPNHFYLKWSLLILLMLSFIVNRKRSFDPTAFIKYCIAINVLFVVIAGVISIVEKENFIVFLNIATMDLVIGGMLFSLCLIHDYRIKFFENNFARVKIIILIVLFLMPILRVFGFGREIFLYLLKPSFFWGISGGLIFTVSILFALNPRDLSLKDEIIDRYFISLSTLIELVLLGATIIICHFTREANFEFLVIVLLLVLITQAVLEAKALTKITTILYYVYMLFIAIGFLAIVFVNQKNQQTMPWWVLIIGEISILLGFVFSMCQKRFKYLKGKAKE